MVGDKSLFTVCFDERTLRRLGLGFHGVQGKTEGFSARAADIAYHLISRLMRLLAAAEIRLGQRSKNESKFVQDKVGEN